MLRTVNGFNAVIYAEGFVGELLDFLLGLCNRSLLKLVIVFHHFIVPGLYIRFYTGHNLFQCSDFFHQFFQVLGATNFLTFKKTYATS